MATWDLFSDGLFTDLIKYNKIDQAEKELTHLETAIARYKKELKDVQMETDLTYEELGEMHRFFDIFFDNIFSDWSTKETIGRNIDMLNELYYEVKNIQKPFRATTVQSQLKSKSLNTTIKKSFVKHSANRESQHLFYIKSRLLHRKTSGTQTGSFCMMLTGEYCYSCKFVNKKSVIKR